MPYREICTRAKTRASTTNSRKLKFLPDRPQTVPARPRYIEPRLLEVLKESYSAWETRGKCPGDIVEHILRMLKEKQNRLTFDLPLRSDSKRAVTARKSPELDWSLCKMLQNTLDNSYRSNTAIVLCPLKIAHHEIIKTHIRGQYLIKDKRDNIVEASEVLKTFACLVKETLPNHQVFKCSTFVEVAGVNGYCVHLCPVVPLPTRSSDALTTVPLGTKQRKTELSELWYMRNGRSTWQPFSHQLTLEGSITLSTAVILLSELRISHTLHLSEEDCVALVSTALEEHARETRYTGIIPLHHVFSLSVRMLLHVIQSSRVIRHPTTKEKVVKKLVFGRTLKRDEYIGNIMQICAMFMKMESQEVFTDLFPPLKTNMDTNETYSSSDEDNYDLMSDVESLELEALDD